MSASLVSDDSFSASIRSYDAGASSSSRGQGPRLIFTSEYIDLPSAKTPNSVANGEMISSTLVSSNNGLSGMPPRSNTTALHLAAGSTAFPNRNYNASSSTISFSRGSSARVGASVSGSTTESLMMMWGGGTMGSSAAAGSISSRSSSANEVPGRLPHPRGPRGHFSPSPRVVASTPHVEGPSHTDSPPQATSVDHHMHKNFANFDVMDLGSVRMHSADRPDQGSAHDDLEVTPSLSLFSGAASDMANIAHVAAMNDAEATQAVVDVLQCPEASSSTIEPREDMQCSKIVANGNYSGEGSASPSLELLKAASSVATDDLTIGQEHQRSSITRSMSGTARGDETGGALHPCQQATSQEADATEADVQAVLVPQPPTTGAPRPSPPPPLNVFSLPMRNNSENGPLTNPLVVVQMPSSSSASVRNEMSTTCNNNNEMTTDAWCAFSPHPPLATSGGSQRSEKVPPSLIGGSDLVLRSLRPMTSNTSQTTNTSSRGLSASQSGTMIPISSAFSNFSTASAISTLPSQLSSVLESSMDGAASVLRTSESILKCGPTNPTPSAEGNPLIATSNEAGDSTQPVASPSLSSMIAVFGHPSTSMLRAGYHQLTVDDGSKCLADESVRHTVAGTSSTSILSSSALQLKPFVSFDVSSSLSREQDDEHATRLGEAVTSTSPHQMITVTIARFCSRDRLRLRRESNAVDHSSMRDDNHSSRSVSVVNRSNASAPPDVDETHPFQDEHSDETISCIAASANKRRISSIPKGRKDESSVTPQCLPEHPSSTVGSQDQRAKNVIESVGGKGAFMELMKSLYL